MENKSNLPTIKEGGIVVALSSIAFALYVQYATGLGNIWIRPDSNQNRRFSPKGLFNMMNRPFHDLNFWRLNNLHMNWLAVTSFSLGTFTFGKFLSNKK